MTVSLHALGLVREEEGNVRGVVIPNALAINFSD